MNRAEKRRLDREAKQSIAIIKSHLDFLNAAGNPKYELKVMTPLKYKLKRVLRLGL